MEDTRRNNQKILRKCTMQFEQSKADASALSLQHDKFKKFFRQRLKMINKKKSASYPTSVNVVSGASKVAEM